MTVNETDFRNPFTKATIVAGMPNFSKAGTDTGIGVWFSLEAIVAGSIHVRGSGSVTYVMDMLDRRSFARDLNLNRDFSLNTIVFITRLTIADYSPAFN